MNHAVEPSELPNASAIPLAVEWIGDINGHPRLIDQTLLPSELVYLDCHDVETVWEAIRSLRVRGAPAIGVAAAMGLVVGLGKQSDEPALGRRLEYVADYLRTSRPTAVNLFWALDRMERCFDQLAGRAPDEIRAGLLAEARLIRDEDAQMCQAIGQHGAGLIEDGWGVLTHCNAGALATSEFGTALSVFYHAQAAGKRIHAYVDETRPLLQGARLTAWELGRHEVPATLICDNMAAVVMRQGKVNAVVVGADRIAANGDTANKIGTYGVAVLAKAHSIPFYVAAPSSTFDFALKTGQEIPIEERDPGEITSWSGRQIAPTDVHVYNPAFDVTPAELVTAFFTEKGVIGPPFEDNLARTLG